MKTHNVIGFTIYNKETGQELATLPLTIPIGTTVEAYKRAGYNITWGWKEEEYKINENS